MSSNPLAALPNPLTPLALLPPDIALQFEASRYLYIAVISAFIWDIVLASGLEWQLLRKHLRVPSTHVYFISRLTTLAFIACSVVFQTGTVSNCSRLAHAIGAFATLTLSSNAGLWYLRVVAIWSDAKLSVVFFTFLLLVNIGGLVTIPLGVDGGPLGPTAYCINTAVKPFVTIALCINAGYDTIVFFAISWKLIFSHGVRGQSVLGAVLSGKGLPVLSKALIQGGQLYYLVTVGFNIVVIILILVPSVSPIVKAMMAIPNAFILNVMATRAFRDIKFGLSAHANPNTSVSSTAHQRGLPRFRTPTVPPSLHSDTIVGMNEESYVELAKMTKSAEAGIYTYQGGHT